MNSIWQIDEIDITESWEDLRSLDLHEVILQILHKRGLSSTDEIKKYLYGTIENEYDPFLLKGMDKAVQRIRKAIDQKEPMLVHGDYDVDGVTAAALMGKTLSKLGAEYFLYLPERLKGGYGVSKKAVYHARERGAKLIITVDCGISALEECEIARSFGIDFLVTDHHQPSDATIPPAVAIVNPWQEGCTYPFKGLSGVGIAYKLSRALLGSFAQENFLDLVAFGTVCDLSILSDENRILVKYGLQIIDKGNNCGLTALKKVAGVRGRKTNTGHLGFMLGPRVNASGRLGSAECALRLLTTDNPKEADSLAAVLNEENKERQKLEQIILKEAVNKVEHEINFNTDKIIVVWSSAWHLGVIGIVAQRLVERFNLPAIVISVDRQTGLCRGSARSVKGFNVFDALTSCKEFLNEFGGHEYAAGIEISIKKLEPFRNAINSYIKEKIGDASFQKTFTIDCEIVLDQIDNTLLEGLELLEPYGRGNSKPLFLTKNLVCKERSIFLNKNTVKLWVSDGEYTYEAIWYKAPSDTKILKGDRLDIIYNLSKRRWYDREVVVLEIKDIKVHI